MAVQWSTLQCSVHMVLDGNTVLCTACTLFHLGLTPSLPFCGVAAWPLYHRVVFVHCTNRNWITPQESNVQCTAVHNSLVYYSTQHCCVLQYTTLHYMSLQFTTLYYMVLQYPTLYYMVLQYTTGYYSTLHCTTWYYRTLQGTTVNYRVLQYTVVYCSTL